MVLLSFANEICLILIIEWTSSFLHSHLSHKSAIITSHFHLCMHFLADVWLLSFWQRLWVIFTWKSERESDCFKLDFAYECKHLSKSTIHDITTTIIIKIESISWRFFFYLNFLRDIFLSFCLSFPLHFFKARGKNSNVVQQRKSSCGKKHMKSEQYENLYFFVLPSSIRLTLGEELGFRKQSPGFSTKAIHTGQKPEQWNSK